MYYTLYTHTYKRQYKAQICHFVSSSSDAFLYNVHKYMYINIIILHNTVLITSGPSYREENEIQYGGLRLQ